MNKPKFVFRHLGINTNDEQSSSQTVAVLCDIFGQESKQLPISCLAGRNIEIMNGVGPGECGHIGFTVKSIPEALKYLSEKGWEADFGTAMYKEDGTIKLVYLKKSIAGFAVHLFEE